MRFGPDGLETAGALWRLPAAAGEHVRQRLVETGALAIRARLAPEDLALRGPGRIVSASLDPSRRNFTLGQEGRNLHLRIRAPGSDENGAKGAARTFGDPLTGKPVEVRATFDGATSRIHVDGRCRGDSPLSLGRGGPLSRDLALAAVVATCAGAALAAAALAPAGRRGWRAALLAVGGLGGTALLAASGGLDLLPHLAGGIVHAVCVAAVLAAAPLALAGKR
jgi:hypothetical protein